jgi:uncharacterized protein YigA (DUF484 family)
LKGYFFHTFRQTKIWLIFLCLIAIVLFWSGYQYIVSINSVSAPKPTLPAPLKIPREYSPSDSLLDLKIERDRNRSNEIEQVRDLMDKAGLSDETRKQAEKELWRLTQATSKEQELETLLKAKGYDESLVTISQNIVTIVLASKLNSGEAAAIGQMASEVTAFSIGQIEIVEKNSSKF